MIESFPNQKLSVGKRRETASLTQQFIRVGAWNTAAAAQKVFAKPFQRLSHNRIVSKSYGAWENGPRLQA
jgi:hypothetical protein